MDLGERLKTIAFEIKKGETMADIGSDHGFLPVYLLEKGISPKVVITDISPGSLDKARQTCMDHGIESVYKADLRLGDGLKVLGTGEVDVVVIAGMGGILMSEIIGFDLDKSRSYARFVLQPRTKAGLLRSRLERFGFDISRFRIVRERGRLCEIMTVTPGLRGMAPDPDMYDIDPDVTAVFDYPDIMIKSPDPLTKKYLELNRKKQMEITKRLEQNASNDERSRSFAEARIKRLDHLLSELR